MPVAAAYIVSDEPIGEWSLDKQRAIWNLRDESYYNLEEGEEKLDDDLIIGEDFSSHAGSSIYDQEAKDYATYDSSVRDKGLNPTDKTNLDEGDSELDKDTQEYTAGPFNIEYTNGIYGDIAFSGISEMVVIGYNKDGEQVRDDIQIEKIILENDALPGIYDSAQTPEYFEPDSVLKVDETAQVYPASGQNFKIVFKNPNEGVSAGSANYVTSISIRIKFKYMLANGQYTKLKGTKYYIHFTANKYNYHDSNSCDYMEPDFNPNHKAEEHYGYMYIATVKTAPQQYHMAADAIRSIYEQEIETGTLEIESFINIDGYVWEDVPSGKENVADGQNGILAGNENTGDIAIPNVKVTLYTSDGNLANLLFDATEEGISDEEIMHRVNPTLTDSNGYYQFEGLDPLLDYYVTFEYNGQIYTPTDYLTVGNVQYTNISQVTYASNDWIVTSKGTEKTSDRTEYNNMFAEIGSSPLNYVSGNSLNSGKLTVQDNKYYNQTFSQNDLMGFVLGEDGNYYIDSSIALIDGFYKIEDGNIVETDTLQQGLISTKIKEYILTNKKYPDDTAMENIYNEIAGNDTELWRKLQFIEDCKIVSYTQTTSGTIEYYNSDRNTYVNQGLWRRQEADISLRKDVAYAATRINGTTEVYTYDKRSQITDEERATLASLREIYEADRTNTAAYQAYLDYLEQVENKYYWEIQLRMRDYNNYYGSNYTREIYPADYTYDSSSVDSANDELELYVTYKITIRNSSISILAQIEEVVDYYDTDYTYMEDLSWIMYKSSSTASESEVAVSEQDYYDTIDTLIKQGNIATNGKDVDAYSSSTYGSASQTNMEDNYNSIYIRGLDSKKLASGEEAYIYLTFKVNSDNDGPVILDEDDSLKQNYVELNGYSTFYQDGTELPNDQTMNSDDPAGLIDVDSNPGNLTEEDAEEGEQTFEDDTDRAKSIKVTLEESATRNISGIVWEDERTSTVQGAVIGDGVRQDDEIGIAGVSVELVEILDDNSQFVWYTTTTNSSGQYSFAEIIPGNYIVRFKYGDTDATVLTSDNGGRNLTSYNGQDFKATVYQKDMTTGTELTLDYGDDDVIYYDIEAADIIGMNLSDARDIWSVREAVNNYSSNNGNGVTNHLAEVLASPYASTVDTNLISELIANTAMTAETGIINLQSEYIRNISDGTDSSNGSYAVSNVDFGLTERPKAQLEINENVTGVKVTLANGTTLFDTNKSTTDLKWESSEAYNLYSYMTNGKYEEYYGTNHRYAYRTEVDSIVSSSYNSGLIQLDMDDELMHGATIAISYAVSVTNAGETDYAGQEFYYKGTGASTIITTSADVVLDYVSNNLQYRTANNDTNTWSLVDSAVSTEELNGNLTDAVAEINTVLKTESLSKDLKPGESTSTVSLVLSQLMTSTNSEDDRTYNNLAEITTISNSAGRRMAYSVQGNQDPTADEPAEVDSTMAEEIIVLPPTGIGEIVTYIAVAIATLAILIGGIILIKKKALKK